MKKVLCLLLCLLVFTGCSTNNQEVEPETTEEPVVEEKVEVPSFTITVNGNEVTEKDMASYELVSYDVELVNSEGTVKNYNYQGYKITDVLDAIGFDANEGKGVLAIATDGYETAYEDNIILDTTLIAVLRDGEPFKEGPWLAPCSSTTNGDYLKNLSEISIAVE